MLFVVVWYNSILIYVYIYISHFISNSILPFPPIPVSVGFRYDELMSKEIANAAAIKEAENALERKSKEMEETMATLHISQEDLKATQKELSMTQETLADTEIVLDSREMLLEVVGTKAECSRDMGTHASTDVSQLHQKVTRKEMLVERNATMTQHLKVNTQDSISMLLENLQEAHTQRSEQNKFSIESLRSVLIRQGNESTKIQEVLASIQERCALDTQAMSELTQSQATILQKTSQQYAEKLASNVEEITMAIDKQREQTKTALDTHVKHLEKCNQNIQTYVTEKVGAAVAAMQQDMTETANLEAQRQDDIIRDLRQKLTHAESELESTKTAASSSLNESHVQYGQVHDTTMLAVDSKLNAVASCVESRDSELQEQSQRQLNESLEEMNNMKTKMLEMFTTFAEAQKKRSETMEKSSSSFTEQVANDVRSTSSELLSNASAEKQFVANEIVLASDATLSQMSSSASKMCNALVETADVLSKETKKSWVDVGKRAVEWSKATEQDATTFKESMEQDTATVMEVIAQHVVVSNDTLQSTKITVDGFTSHEQQHTQEMATLTTNMSSSIEQQCNNTLATVTSSVDSVSDDFCNYGESIVQDVETTVTSLDNACKNDEVSKKSLVEASKNIEIIISKHALERYAPTGTTPAKREYVFPSPVQRMLPRPDALARAKGIVIDVGGETNEVEDAAQQEEDVVAQDGDAAQQEEDTAQEEATEKESPAATEDMDISSESSISPATSVSSVDDDAILDTSKVVKDTKQVKKKEAVKKRRSRRGNGPKTSGIPRAKRSLNRRTLSEKN